MKKYQSMFWLAMIYLFLNQCFAFAQVNDSLITTPPQSLKIAVLQAGRLYCWSNPGLESNFNLYDSLAREAAKAAPDLIVFPEYAISGWPYPPEKIMNSLAESIPGEGYWFQRYMKLVQAIKIPLLGWLVDKDSSGHLYNASFLLDKKAQFSGKYRKVHANLGEQIWWGWSQGETLEPLTFRGVNFGISICADMWYPETVLCEDLLGANVIIHQSIADDMMHLMPARASDSHIPIICAIFQGGSYAVDQNGKLLGKCSANFPEWRIFEVKPFEIEIGNKYGGRWYPEQGRLNIRNVDAYKILVDPSTRPPWTGIFLNKNGKPQTKEELIRRFNGRYDAHDPEN